MPLPVPIPPRIRPLEERDLEEVVAIHNATNPFDTLTLQDAHRDHTHWDSTRHFRLRLVAESSHSRLIAETSPSPHLLATAEIAHSPRWFHPHHYRLDLRVHPTHQRQGIGDRLLTSLIEALQARHATLIRTEVPESSAGTIAFFTHRHFVEVQRIWESRLDVTQFDFSRFATAEDRAIAQAITFTTLDQEVAHNRDHALSELYALHSACRRDVPALDPPTDEPYEEFRDWWQTVGLVSHTHLPDGYLIAKHGNRWVGQSGLWQDPADPHILNQGMTGVIREFRGRGIAMALKVRGLRLARVLGKRTISTGNDSLNAPMLRINDALGFQRHSARITLQRSLAAEP